MACICLLYVTIYIWVKAGVLKFIARLLIGIILGSIVMLVLTSILGKLGIVISVCVALYSNRKRIAVLKKYTDFIWYSIGGLCIPVGCLLAVFVFGTAGALLKSNTMFLIAVIFALGYKVLPYVIMSYALKREEGKGRPFLQTVYMMNVIPIVCLLCCISFLTLFHFEIVSGESIFGPDGHDFLDDYFSNTGIAHAESIDNAPPMDSGVDNAPDSVLSTDVNEPVDMTAHQPIENTSFTDLSDTSSSSAQLRSSDVVGSKSATAFANQEFAENHIVQAGDNVEPKSSSIGTMTEPVISHTVDMAAPKSASGASITEVNGHIDMSAQHPTDDSSFTNMSVPDTSPAQIKSSDIAGSTSATVFDSHGFTKANIVSTGDNSFVVQGSDNLRIGSISTDTITGDISMYDNFGFQEGTITGNGTIQGVDGLSDGRIVQIGDTGKYIIQDAQFHTIGHIHPNGIITDTHDLPIGKIK